MSAIAPDRNSLVHQAREMSPGNVPHAPRSHGASPAAGTQLRVLTRHESTMRNSKEAREHVVDDGQREF
jgi:hypothetical protein